jgi:hypothetical protein
MTRKVSDKKSAGSKPKNGGNFDLEPAGGKLLHTMYA